MTKRIAKLKIAIETMHHCAAYHLESSPVFEAFQGKVIWEGVVETFEIVGHSKAFRCYAWPFTTDQGGELFATILEIPPVDSPETAVKMAIASGQINPS